MAWHDVVIVKEGTNISWFIDGLRIVTAPDPGGLSTNIFVGYSDINAGQSGNPSQSFGLVDNLRVEALYAPHPTITAICYDADIVESDFKDIVAHSPHALTLASHCAVT